MEQNIINFFILLIVLYALYYLTNKVDKVDNLENTPKDCSDKSLNDGYSNYIFGTPLSKLIK
jgi:hypothetical protein